MPSEVGYITFVNPSVEHFTPSTGGAISTVVVHVAQEFLKRGQHVQVLAPTSTEPPYAVVPFVPINFRPNHRTWLIRKIVGAHRRLVGHPGHMYGLYLWHLRRALKKASQPGVFICHNDFVVPRYLKRWFPGVPVVLWLHNEVRVDDSARRGAALADHVIVVSEYIAKYAKNHLEVPPERITVALNGVDGLAFRPALERKATGPIKALFLGRLLRDKGADLLLRAVQVLQGEGLSIEVTVVGSVWWWGDADGRDVYLNEVVLPLVEQVGGAWHPHIARDRVPRLLQQHDVLAVLSRFPDPCPLVVLEGMAAGCAVLATATGGIPEQVDDRFPLLPIDDIDAVVDRLRRLALNPSELAQQRTAGRRRAEELPWSRTASLVAQALERIERAERQDQGWTGRSL